MRSSEFVFEKWSQKYKSSINCSHPRGFSQKAHCAGKQKQNESVEMEMVCETCGMCETHGSLNEIAKGQKDANGYTRCWPGKHAEGTKKGKNGGQVRDCVPNESVAESTEGRCRQCGMKNCKCPGDSCKCKPIAGWVPNKGFRKAMDEDLSRRGFLRGLGAAAVGAGAAGSTLGQTINLHDIPGNVLPKSFGGPDQREELQARFDRMPLGQKITWLVKPNISYSGPAQVANPSEVEVRCAPDGTIVGIKLIKSSGTEEWDNAVLKAVQRNKYFPSDENGKVQPLIVISFDPGLEQKRKENLQRMQQAASATGPANESVAQGVAEDTELAEEFDLIESIIEGIAEHNGVDAEAVWADLESLTEDELYAFAVTSQLNEDWQKANKRDRTDGMSQKAVNAYRRENPGSKLKTAVTTKPSKLKKGGKASKRRKSYCSRSRGQMKMHSISCAKTPDKAICKARRRWNC